MFRSGIRLFGHGLWLWSATAALGLLASLLLMAGTARAGDPVQACDTGNQQGGADCSVSGTVFSDLDGNGIQGTLDAGLANWTVYADFDGDAALDQSEPSTLTAVSGGYLLRIATVDAGKSFQVREQLLAGWRCTFPTSSCSYEEQPFLLEDGPAAQAEDRSHRDFGNVQEAISPTAGPAQAGVSTVAANKTASTGKASLRTPRGCPAQRARLSVQGSGIGNVSFYLDSRKLMTVIKPDPKGRFNYTFNTSKLKAGVHRVRAQVTFVAASATASKTLAATIRRCASRATPKFTG